MASLKAPTVPKLKVAKPVSLPKVKPAIVKGAPVAKIKPPQTMKTTRLSSPAFGAQKALAKAAAGASYVRGKRNPNYPTP